ncbi:hypothetical protein GCM10027053_30490 [Intrasporangium mesophilum]
MTSLNPKTIPGWTQAVVEVNPITHLATVVRRADGRLGTRREIGWVLVSSVLLVAVFGPITMVLYRNKK